MCMEENLATLICANDTPDSSVLCTEEAGIHPVSLYGNEL